MPHELPQLRSGYYPPRARAWSGWRQRYRLFQRMWDGLREFDRGGVRWGPVLAAVFIPGMGFYICGRKLLGGVMFACWLLGLWAFLSLLTSPPVTFGGFQFDPAFVAAGLMISAHASPLSFFLQRLWPAETFWERLGIGVATTLALILLAYWPAGRLFQRYIAIPVYYNGQVILLQPNPAPASIKHGDLVAFTLPRYSQGNLRFQGGLTLGILLAFPGESVEFGPAVVRVGGAHYLPMDHMPKEGSLVVGTNTWFIWPHLVRWGAAAVPESTFTQVYTEMASVPLTNFVGKAYSRWLFWRSEI